ncbi:MAG: hypothetical protein ABFD60_04175 [Bryobacteraceae bacterium]
MRETGHHPRHLRRIGYEWEDVLEIAYMAYSRDRAKLKAMRDAEREISRRTEAMKRRGR